MIVNFFVIQTDGKTFQNKLLEPREVSEVKIHDNFKFGEIWMEVVEILVKSVPLIDREKRIIEAVICKENPYHHASNEETNEFEGE